MKENKKDSSTLQTTVDGDLLSSLSYCEVDNDEEELEDDEVDTHDSWTLYKLGDLAIQWRPHRLIHKISVLITLPLLLWTICFLLVGNSALPGGIIFTLFILEFGGIGLGLLVRSVKLPALLGMLAIGLIIKNVPYIDYGKNMTSDVSSPIRQLALVIILIKAGIGLDPAALVKLRGFVLALAFIPSFIEALIIAIGTAYILQFPWTWAFLLGFIVSAVSPAVIVPCLLGLKKRGYGLDNGISTIVVAVASLADILSISLFGVAIGFAFSTGGLVESIIQGPIEIIFGIAFGLVWGYIMGIIFMRNSQRTREDKFLHVIFTFGGGIISIFGFQYLSYPGAGPLACLILAFVAGLLLRKKKLLKNDIDDDSLSWAFGILWYAFQPLLFGLIGCEIDVLNLDGRVVGFGALCLIFGIVGRFVITFFILHSTEFDTKEKTFVTMAWIPKATVQAALGPVALDAARKLGAGPILESLGLQVLTIAVVAILLTAPLGASAITILGPKLLRRKTFLIKKTSDKGVNPPDSGLEGMNSSSRKYGSIADSNTGAAQTTKVGFTSNSL